MVRNQLLLEAKNASHNATANLEKSKSLSYQYEWQITRTHYGGRMVATPRNMVT